MGTREGNSLQDRLENGPGRDFSRLVRALPRIAEIILNGADSIRKGDIDEVHLAIEMASQLFLEQIT